MGSFNKFKKVLEEKGSFLLICHIDPDGDAIGSMMALKDYLKRAGKKTYMLSKDSIPEVFSFLDSGEEIRNDWPQKFEAIILLDNGDFKRTGFTEEILRQKKNGIPVINIDHHPKNDIWKIASVNLSNPEASSTCEILAGIFLSENMMITPSVATSLLAGIFYDTGGFQHQNTSKIVLDLTSELLKRGARLKRISEKLSGSRPISLFKLWGIALKRLAISNRYKLAVSFLKRDDLLATGASEEEISGLVNLLNSIPEAQAALLIYESADGKIKGSLRTEKDDLDLSKLAIHLGGGGHKKAAGFSITGQIEKDKHSWHII